MANTIRIKRRASGNAGAPASLQNAELAFNEVDDVLYYGKGTGGAGGTATSVIAIGGTGAFVGITGNQSISGTKTFTGTVDLTSATATATTQLQSDNSTKLATTAYVRSAVGAVATSFTVAGDSGTSQTITSGTDTLTIAGGSGINTVAGATDTVTISVNTSVVTTLTNSQTLSNKSLSDSTTFFIDDADATKKMQFQLSGVTTATTRTLTVPDVSGTIITTGDTGTVTNTMLAGSIQNAKLANSAITINSSSTSLGGSVTLYAGTTALQTSSANQALTGISSVTLPGSTSGTIQLLANATAGTGTVITLPATTGTVITSGDTGTVTNTMLAGSIADSKLNTISTANKVSLTALDIDGGTDIGSALADADLIIVDDGGAGTNRKAAVTRMSDYVFGKVTGDITVAANGVATISANSVILGTDTTGNYVATIAGTTDQVNVSGSGSETAAVTLSLPQSIATTSSPSFAGVTLSANAAVNGGFITTTASTASLFAANASNINIGSASSTVNIGNNLAVAGNLTVNGNLTTINSSTISVDDKNLELGSVAAVTGLQATLSTGTAVVTLTTGTTSGLIVGQALTKTAGTGAFGASPTIASIDSATQFTASVNHGTAGAITFDAGGATDTTANGGGITVKGATDKTLNWVLADTAWSSSEDFNLASGKVYKIAGTSVLSANTLGSGISTLAAASLTVNTIASGTWNGSVIAGQYGGTGVNNSGKTITLGGNLTTSGAFALTLTTTASTNVTLPTTGTLATLAGSESISNKTITNSSIGSSNPSTAAFTTLTANGATTLTANTSSTSTGTGTLVVTGGVGVSQNIWLGGSLNGSTGTNTLDGFTIDGGTF